MNTRILTRSDIADLLSVEDCIRAVEDAFRLHAEGRSLGSGVLSLHVEGGAFHIKAAGLHLGRSYFAAKINGNFFHNIERFGMPRIQGAVILADAENGFPLAILDSSEITIRRTGAATAVAAKHLARPDSRVVTIIGCGNQGRISLRALRALFPIDKAFVFDLDSSRAERFAGELGSELKMSITAVGDFADGTRVSDICVTCTPSREAFLRREHVARGAFIAAVGADSSEKQEIDPELLASSRLFVDHLEQCATFGDLQHALARGVMTRDDVAGELGEVIARARPGRTSREEVVIFDSTGMALQDVAAAAIVYERSIEADRGVGVQLSA